jgi:membrane associated rhomboid family serine protease
MSYRPAGFTNPFGFAVTPWVKRLLIANLAVWVVTAFAFPQLLFYGSFVPAETFSRPWGILTYMFLHANFWHLFFNLIGLFFFGPPLEDRWGSSEFLKFYVICGIGGAALSMLWWDQGIIGASGAVYGVMLGYAYFWPDNPIYIWGILPVKAKYLVIFLALMSLFSALGQQGTGVAHLAHLGGFAAALIYLKSPYAPSAFGGIGGWTSAKPKRSRPSPREAAAKVRKTLQLDRIQRTEPPTVEEEKILDDVDRILDKISAKGLQSLTPEEREKLDEASKRYRTN